MALIKFINAQRVWKKIKGQNKQEIHFMGRNFVQHSARLHSGVRYLLESIQVYVTFFLTNDTNITSYPNDNTPFGGLTKTNLAFKNVNSVWTTFLHGFYNNEMRASVDKWDFLVSTKVSRNKTLAKISVKIRISDNGIESRPHQLP